MSQQNPPPGWYENPDGHGGRRFWDGHAWTDRTQPAAGARTDTGATGTGRERIPDGFMQLNGQTVRLGQTSSLAGRPRNRGMIVALLVALGVALAIGVGVLASTGSTWLDLVEDDSSSGITIEVEADRDSDVDLHWSDGRTAHEETAVSQWQTEFEAPPGPATVVVTARPTDRRAVVTCRILDPGGSVVAEARSTFAGASAVCTHYVSTSARS